MFIWDHMLAKKKRTINHYCLYLSVVSFNDTVTLIFKHPVTLLYLTYNIIISVTMQPRKTYLYTLFSHNMFRP
jgi:hypothetical protein